MAKKHGQLWYVHHGDREPPSDWGTDRLRAELDSERTARREAEEDQEKWRQEWKAEEKKVAQLIAAVEEHERLRRKIIVGRMYSHDLKLWDRVRSISQGDSE